MTSKRSKLIAGHSPLILLCFWAIVTLVTGGCLLSKQAVVTSNGAGGFTTNIVTVVDEANLAIDASVLEVVTATAVIRFKNNPQVVSALQDAHKALDGIIEGSNSATTQDVINILKIQGNSQLTDEVSSLVKIISLEEQKLIVKYGSSVAGKIALAVTRAVDAGIVIGLAQ